MRRRRPGHGHAGRAPALRAEPLLLVPGLGQGSWIWRWVEPALSRRFRVVSFDNRGTGALAHLPARRTVEELADDALAALVGAGAESAHVVGLSMGGYVALTLALARPDVVRSLVLAGTGAGGSDRVPRPRHVVDAFDAALGLAPDEFGRRTMPYTFAPGWAEANPERFEEILAARHERPTPYEAIDGHVAACYAFYAAAVEVERIDHAALVIHGSEDLIVPVENGRRLAQRLPDARYVELEGAGHNLPLEDPETFTRLVLNFLGTPPTAPPSSAAAPRTSGRSAQR